jgi:hypothetical protein
MVLQHSVSPGSVDFLGHKLGEDNEEILGGELGLSKETLKELKEAGII